MQLRKICRSKLQLTAAAAHARASSCDNDVAHLEVGVVELVRDVPAQHAELASLKQHRVEEAEREQQLLVPAITTHRNMTSPSGRTAFRNRTECQLIFEWHTFDNKSEVDRKYSTLADDVLVWFGAARKLLIGDQVVQSLHVRFQTLQQSKHTSAEACLSFTPSVVHWQNYRMLNKGRLILTDSLPLAVRWSF